MLLLPQQHTEIEGHLKLGVLTYDRATPEHKKLLREPITNIIRTVAQSHNTSGRSSQVGRVMSSLQAGDLEATFLMAAWDLNKAKAIGGAIHFHTVGLKRYDNSVGIGPGIYTDDICLFKDRVSEIAGNAPAGCYLPRNYGLAEFFEKETFRIILSDNSPFRTVPTYRVGEVDPQNAPMIKLMGKVSAELGLEDSSAVFEAKDLQRIRFSKNQQPVEIVDIFTSMGKDPNNFATRWVSPQKDFEVVFSYTKGFKTTRGETVVQAQAKSNGNPPEQTDVGAVVSSLLLTGMGEVGRRGWQPFGAVRQPQTQGLVAESDPSQSDKKYFDIRAASKELCGNSLDGGLMKSLPSLVIHSLNEPQITLALQSMGFSYRQFGSGTMKPGIIDFSRTLSKLRSFTVRTFG